ncbi:hypothetical protein BGW41_006759 [Actinomortierella wolfii]|nr:hypothetical protein BGW41_006759 [Actinomortierella wolfii]
MLQQTPLALPELRLLVASFLAYDDIKACAIVCKTWHQDFQPLVWRHLTANFSKHRKPFVLMKAARMDSIRKNAHWIRDFRHMMALGSIVIPELYDILFDRCRSLLSFEARIMYDDEWHVLQKLIRLNVHLRQLDLTFTASPWLIVSDLQLPTILHGHPTLRTFRTNYSMKASMLLRILNACPSLEEVCVHIELSPPWLSDPDAIDEGGKGVVPTTGSTVAPINDTTPFQLRRLELGGTCDDPDLGVLLERCPMLEHLRLAPLPEKTIRHVYKALSHLVHLSSLVTTMTRDLPSPLEAMVKALPRHQLRNVEATCIDAQAIQKLVEFHHKSLVHVRLHITSDAQEAVADLFSRCSNLRTLIITTAGFTLDADRLIRVPWVRRL